MLCGVIRGNRKKRAKKIRLTRRKRRNTEV
jgi:hypothetical protein